MYQFTLKIVGGSQEDAGVSMLTRTLTANPTAVADVQSYETAPTKAGHL